MSIEPDNEQADRLFAIQATRLVNSPVSESFDRITRLAADLFDMPTALVSLVTADKQWFKSRVGRTAIGTDRKLAFCAFTLHEPSVLVVEDATLDERFRSNPLVTGEPGIRFYAGAPLLTSAGNALGSLCVVDYKPRTFLPAQRKQLADMARIVLAQIDLIQAAGHVNDVTRLPNRAQLSDDLEDLRLAGDIGSHTLVLVDVMSHSQVQSALLAVGIPALEFGLRQIAARFLEIVDGRSPLYHVRETCFVYVLRGPDTTYHTETIEQVLFKLSRPSQAGEMTIELDLECGSVNFDSSEADATDLLRKAASAMHEAEYRKLPFLMYQPSFDATHQRVFAILRALPAAMSSGHLRLVYQPKLDVILGRFTTVEALARWRHPIWGNVSPAEFISAIENTTAIHLFTEWVLHIALAQLVAWHANGLLISIAINVSACNLEHPNFVKLVQNACNVHGVNPRLLQVECTETAVMTGERILSVLNELRDMGVQISLDDFGIGYSNIACLQKLPLGLLKIDQSLVKPIADDDRAWALLQSLISLGHTLGYRVLAEGVENAVIYKRLANAGCDSLQGYFLSKPLEAGVVATFMREQQKKLAELAVLAKTNPSINQR